MTAHPPKPLPIFANNHSNLISNKLNMHTQAKLYHLLHSVEKLCYDLWLFHGHRATDTHYIVTTTSQDTLMAWQFPLIISGAVANFTPRWPYTCSPCWMKFSPAGYVSPPCIASTQRCTSHPGPAVSAGRSPAPPGCPAGWPEDRQHMDILVSPPSRTTPPQLSKSMPSGPCAWTAVIQGLTQNHKAILCRFLV